MGFLKRFFGSRPLSATDYLDRASRNYEAREYDRAIVDFSEAIRLDPQSASAYLGRGKSYNALDDKSPVELNEAFRRDVPAHSYQERDSAYEDRAQATRVPEPSEAADRAIADLNEAIRLEAGNADAYYERGLAFRNKNPYRAIADLTEAICLNPGHLKAYAARCGMYLVEGDLKQALADCSEAIKHDPANPMRYGVRAEIYRDLGEHAMAVQDECKVQELALTPPPQVGA
jgi:tetratricopeptide (TPR) repeat protein